MYLPESWPIETFVDVGSVSRAGRSIISYSKDIGKRAMCRGHVGKPEGSASNGQDLNKHAYFMNILTIHLYHHRAFHYTFFSNHCKEIKVWVLLCSSSETSCLLWMFVCKYSSVCCAEGVPGIHCAVLRSRVAAHLESVSVRFISHGKWVVSGHGVDVVLIPHVHLQLVVVRTCEP